MSVGARAQATVTRLITNGKLWTHEATFTYGPRRAKTNPWDEAVDGASISPQTLKVAAFPEEKALEDGGRKITMWEIIVPAASITVRPTEEDTVSIDGVVNEILSVDPIGANAVNAAYLIMAMR